MTQGWLIRRAQGQRALRLTDAGRDALATHLGVTLDGPGDISAGAEASAA